MNLQRDLDILYALGRMKFLWTQDLQRLAFSSRQACVRRLAKLFGAGLIHCFVPAVNGENLYSLSTRGKALLVERDGCDAQELRTARNLGRTDLKHLTAINRIRISLAVACKNTPGVHLGCFRSDWDLRAETPAWRGTYLPDAMFVLERESGSSQAFALEVDLGGESLGYFVKHKVGPLLAAARAGTAVHGFHRPRLLVVSRGQRRLVNLARSVAEAGGNELALIGDLEQLNEHNVLGPAFARPRDLATAQTRRSAPWARRLLQDVAA